MIIEGCATRPQVKPEVIDTSYYGGGSVVITLRVPSTNQTRVVCSISLDGQKVAANDTLIFSGIGKVQIIDYPEKYMRRPVIDKTIDCVYG